MSTPPVKHLAQECENSHEKCDEWARVGECDRNKKYMQGDGFSLGACRKACEQCEPCDPGDRECGTRNRIRAGYLPLDD